MSRFQAFWCFASILFFFGCNKETTNDLHTLTETGISKQLAVHRHKTISDINYGLSFVIPQSRTEKIEATAIIECRLANDLSPLILDLKINPQENLIHSLVVNGQKAQPEMVNDHIVIPEDLLVSGMNHVEIKYQAPETSLNRDEDFLYTLLVPDRASTLFPCFDQPDLKANFSLSLTVPREWATVANGSIQSEEIAENQKRVIYATEGPFSTYLFAFATGKFEKVEREINGRNFIMYHREPDQEKVLRNLDEIFNLHAKAYDWMESYTGIPYPFGDYEFCLIPAFAYGGMEHPGAIWYRSNLLFLEEDPTRDQELRRATLIAHEVSHMWFGDLVTMKWFDDVWLKEVYANFFADLIVQDDFADIDRKLRFIYDQYPRAYRIDRSEGTHPVQQELNNLKEAGTLYGGIIYNKAPIVMKHLELMMGEDNMQAGLREYLTRYKYGNASWDDLVNILSQVSGKDLSRWNRDWIKTEGQPHFTLEQKETPNGRQEYIIRQNGEFIKEQDLLAEFLYADTIKTYKATIQDEEYVININENVEPVFINIFGDNYEYGYYELSPESVGWLLDNVNSEKDDSRRLVFRMMLWEHFVNGGIHPGQFFPVLLKGIENERDPLVLQYTLANVSEIFWRFIAGNNDTRSENETTRAILNRMQSEQDPKMKRSLWESYYRMATQPEGLDFVYQVWSKQKQISGLSFSEDDFISMAANLCLNKHPDWKNIISEQGKQIKNPDSHAKFEFNTSALSNDPEERQAYFKKITVLANRRKEDWVQTGLSYLHHPFRTGESIVYLRPTLDMLQEIQRTGDIFFPFNVLQNSFEYYTSGEAVQIADDFLNANPDYPPKLKNKILQATDMMKRSHRINGQWEIGYGL